ncbi:MAG: DUF1949 domain-containing protein [Acidobacteria bacterium]|nr:MAG: DUF1949 domain-containing protein [Acidobacteriota bacterium]
MSVIRTVRSAVRHEMPKVKGSRFIASLAPAGDVEQAMDFVAARRAEFRDATHNCFAWRLALDENAFRYSDDGEPAGTAGRPILQEIDGRRLSDVVVVVTRYFGGTRLGTGGLVRAYGGAAAAALERAEIVERPVVRTLSIHYPYELSGAVQGVLARFALAPAKADYGAEIAATVAVPVADAERLAHALREATAGRAQVAFER